MIKIQVDPAGLASTYKLLANLEHKTEDLTPVWAQVDQLLNTFWLERFGTHGAYGGDPWADLRPSTVKNRGETIGGKTGKGGKGTAAQFTGKRGRARGGLFAQLWDTGRLRASLIKPGPESIHVVQPLSYARGTTVPYARWHQTGFTIRKWGKVVFKDPVKVPARRLMPDPLPAELVAQIDEAIAKHLKG